ncbi:uncharacterized protein LOC142415398 [Mycteria americana]|uniref:uncharacterized protein LOC142415398 n=1 Tax=Mycteria americana TaxID=33587 RepID=UPI003F585759
MDVGSLSRPLRNPEESGEAETHVSALPVQIQSNSDCSGAPLVSQQSKMQFILCLTPAALCMKPASSLLSLDHAAAEQNSNLSSLAASSASLKGSYRLADLTRPDSKHKARECGEQRPLTSPERVLPRGAVQGCSQVLFSYEAPTAGRAERSPHDLRRLFLNGSPADGALLPRGGAAVPALLAGARRSPPGRPGRRRAGRAGAGAGPGGGARGSAEARFCPRERFAARCRFWPRLKPAPPPARELCVSPKGSQTRSPKKQRKGGKLGSRRSPRPGGKSSSPHKVGRSVTPRPPANSCLPAPRSRAARGSSPAGRPPTDRPGPRPRLRSPPPSRRQVPACLHRGGGSGSRERAGCCPAGPAPARTTSALSGRRQGTPAAAGCSFSGPRPPVMLNFPVPSAGAAGLGGAGGRAIPALAPARPLPAGAATGPSTGAPTARPGAPPVRGAAPRTHRDEDPRPGLRPGPGQPLRSGAAPGPARESVTPAQRPVRAAAHPRSVSKQCLRQPRRALRRGAQAAPASPLRADWLEYGLSEKGPWPVEGEI